MVRINVSSKGLFSFIVSSIVLVSLRCCMPCLKYPILALAATGTWKLTNASKKVVFPVPLSPTIASLLPVMISFGEKNFGMNYAIVFLGYSGGAFVGLGSLLYPRNDRLIHYSLHCRRHPWRHWCWARGINCLCK